MARPASKKAKPTAEQIATAERAVRMFNKMLPTLEGFVEALTGKHMSIKLGRETFTDGRTIHISPPYAFGVEGSHSVRLCDARDDMGVPMCSACDDREKLLALVYHEISHVAFGTFVPLNAKVVCPMIREIPSVHADDLSKKVARHLELSPTRRNIQQVGAIINDFLPGLCNAFEDIRVDTAMKEARPGTAFIQHVLYARVIRDGSIVPGGEPIRWSDRPLNAQASVAMICYSLGMPELLDYMDPYLKQVINEDDQLRVVLDRAAFAKNPDESFVNSLEAMIRMQQHGFFDDGDPLIEPEPEPPTEEEDGDDDGSDGGHDGVQPDSSDEDSPGGGGDESTPGSGGSGDESPVGDDDGPGDGSPDGAPEDGADGDGSDEASPGADGAVDDEADAEERDNGEGGDGDSGGTAEPDDASGTGEAVDDDSLEDAGDGGEPGPSGSGAGGGADESGVSDPDEGDSAASSEEGVRDVSPSPGGDHSEERPDSSSFGNVSDAVEALKELLGHDENQDFDGGDEVREQNAVASVVETFEHFDAPSAYIDSVRIRKAINEFPSGGGAKPLKEYAPESILGPALMVLRKVLEENKRSKMDRNRRSGRVNARVLGRRAWGDDDRLFQRKVVPGKRDYAVLIGIDISGSTSRRVERSSATPFTLCDLSVRAAYAQAEMCSRLGIKFAVYAHTGGGEGVSGMALDIFEVKSFDAPWNHVAIQKMGALRSRWANLDGHTMEYYRKAIDRVQATDKIIMYYSDGAMPAENYNEELEILKREIKICQKKDITLMAVGVHTDAPKEHGLDTVRLDSMSDISKVVKHLGDRILKG